MQVLESSHTVGTLDEFSAPDFIPVGEDFYLTPGRDEEPSLWNDPDAGEIADSYYPSTRRTRCPDKPQQATSPTC